MKGVRLPSGFVLGCQVGKGFTLRNLPGAMIHQTVSKFALLTLKG